MQSAKPFPITASLRPSNHPYLNGAWTPQHDEVTALALEVLEGAIPTDIDGIYLRNTENQIHQPCHGSFLYTAAAPPTISESSLVMPA